MDNTDHWSFRRVTFVFTIFSLEKKFHDLQTEHEQEKIELQKAQTSSIQQLMDDTSERLQKMEDDYRKQSKAMGKWERRAKPWVIKGRKSTLSNKWCGLIFFNLDIGVF